MGNPQTDNIPALPSQESRERKRPSAVGSSNSQSQRIRKYAEQFTVFLLGALAAFIILYVLYLFSPYLFPIAMAAFLSIPIAALTCRLNRILIGDFSAKLERLAQPGVIMSMICFWYCCWYLLDAVIATIALSTALAIYFFIPRLGTKMFLLFWLVVIALMTILIIACSIKEFVHLSVSVIERKNRADSVFLRYANNMVRALDDLIKRHTGTSLTELVFKAVNFLGGESAVRALNSSQSTISGLGTRLGLTLPQEPKLDELLRNLPKLRSQLNYAEIYERFQGLLTTQRLLHLAHHALGLLHHLLNFVIDSANIIVQAITFTYFLFYFLNRQESILRYFSRLFSGMAGVHQFVDQLEAACEFAILRYTKMIAEQFAMGVVVFLAVGSRLPITFGLLAAWLAMIPLVTPSAVAFLVAVEMFLAGKSVMAVLTVIIHWTATWFLIPPLQLYRSPDTNYLAELSVLAGFWTFGTLGLLAGPVLASTPSIIYRVILNNRDRGTGDQK